MNPDKLFDYLDGKLSPADRDELEKRLSNDSQLLRQLAIARDIHRGMGGSREVVMPVETAEGTERAGRLGRRIATGAIALVLLNVLLGLAFVAKSKKTTAPSAKEAAIREQLTASLGAAGRNALPAPTFVEDEVHISAPRAEWDAVSAKIIAASERCGGSAAKGLPDEAALTVYADVPSSRKTEFRELVLPTTSAASSPHPASSSSPEATSPNERSIVQVRIAESMR